MSVKHSHTPRLELYVDLRELTEFSRLTAFVDCQVLVGLVIARGIVCIVI